MEQLPSNIQVLLQAAEYVERREREAEHGYASILPCDPATPGRRKRQRTYSNPENVSWKEGIKPIVFIAMERQKKRKYWSVHNELEKHRRAQLRRCLEQLKQQVPVSVESSRHTTLSLLHRAKQHIKKLEDQELRAKSMKEKLRTEQQKLRQRLKQLLPPNTERIRADSLDSSALSSERSDSDQEDLEVDVEGIILSGNEGDLFVSFSAGMEHSYSTPAHAWL